MYSAFTPPPQFVSSKSTKVPKFVKELLLFQVCSTPIGFYCLPQYTFHSACWDAGDKNKFILQGTPDQTIFLKRQADDLIRISE